MLLAVVSLKGLFSVRLKGAAGERAVRQVLDRLGGAALHNIILPDGRGGLTQIDHLVLTQAGLLVIETKNYAGQVVGQAEDPTWTQRLGSRHFTFQNPLRQNYLHIQALKALSRNVPIQGRVVFTDRAQFPEGMPEGVSTIATLRDDLKPLVSGPPASAACQRAWTRIATAARTDRASRKAHRVALQARHGRDRRRAVAVGLLMVAVVWLAVLFARLILRRWLG